MVRLIKKIIQYVFGKDLGSETIRYLIVGGLTTLVNFSLFLLMYEILGIDDTVSNVTSIAVSILFAYITNKLVVFRQHCDSMAALALEFIKFVGSRLFTMALEVGVVLLFTRILYLNATLGKVVAVFIVIVVNYFISKLIVFRSES